MSQLFLVRSKVSRRAYMADRSQDSEELDLVWADDCAQAERKALAHYEAQGSDYGTSVMASVLEVKQAIA